MASNVPGWIRAWMIGSALPATMMALVACKRANRAAACEAYFPAISTPRKLCCGLACDAVAMNRPFPEPISSSSGRSLSNND